MTRIHKLDYESPIGVIEITDTDKAIRSILFSNQSEKQYTKFIKRVF